MTRALRKDLFVALNISADAVTDRDLADEGSALIIRGKT
jgi:hypothetical protein